MKRFVLFVFLLNVFFTSFATDYYSQGSVSPNILTNWNVNPGGGGATPTSFTVGTNKFIIQNGHTMTTSAIWTLGNGTSTLQIQSGGILQGDHLIQFTGTFQIDDGGKYIHNNTDLVNTTPGASIWGGTESFGANSTVEIRDWVGNTPIPPSTTWGNVIINVTRDLGGVWNQDGTLRT